MQTLEALISLLVLVSIATPILRQEAPAPLDDSLYRLQLAGDVWRVLYLRGDFRDFDNEGMDAATIALHDDCNNITAMTGLCVEFDQINAGSANCKGTEKEIATIMRTLIVRGKPETHMMTIKG